MQVYSSAMTENLINDMMDLAKLENNKFKIDRAYFSLIRVIENSFAIVHKTAMKAGIDMKAVIDQQSNLDLIQ